VLIEDVASLTGYDQIPLAQPVGELTSGKRNSLDALRRRVTLFLANTGFLESRNLSLESPELILQTSRRADDAVTLVNSKEDMSLLRKSLVPGLLETVSRNTRRDAENFRYFELDRTFRRTPDGTVEHWSVAAVAGGLTRDVDWSQSKTKVNFFHMKGVAESLLESAGVEGATFRPATRPGFAEGQTAEMVSGGGDLLGIVGAIDGALLTPRKIKEEIYAFEFNLESILNAAAGVHSFKDIPRTPSIVRDIALVIDASTPYADIEARVGEVGGVLLENVRCIDVYEGKHIERGHRSISIRLRFRDPQRTLSTEEVSLTVDRLVNALTQEYGAKLRE
jgi:phenylalanyl-tRNA synthetase beta chain